MDKPTTLAKYRAGAALASGGTSDFRIKECVLSVLRKRNIDGRLLDYGAGTGELLNLISNEFPDLELVGADLMSRPNNLASRISWVQQDLNEKYVDSDLYDVVVCSEVIEHLENPRHTMREIANVLKPGGALILTTPNQESIRSILAVIFGGHFAGFLGLSYPAHITALLRLDLIRICHECRFGAPEFAYTNYGGIPKSPHVSWQSISFGFLKGRLFSDNIIMIANKG